jgi:hypothetical protein
MSCDLLFAPSASTTNVWKASDVAGNYHAAFEGVKCEIPRTTAVAQRLVVGGSEGPMGSTFSLDRSEEGFLHSFHARKEVVQWTVGKHARWLTLRFEPSVHI